MRKYWWEVVQAAEFVDGSVVIEKGKYQGCGIGEVLDIVYEHNDTRNDAFVGAKIIGVKITGLEM